MPEQIYHLCVCVRLQDRYRGDLRNEIVLFFVKNVREGIPDDGHRGCVICEKQVSTRRISERILRKYKLRDHRFKSLREEGEEARMRGIFDLNFSSVTPRM